MKKIVIIDSGFITHQSILGWGAQKKKQISGELKTDFILPATYNYFNSCISILKKIGINKDDLVIVARDGRNSWRKAFYPIYKGNRKGNRDQHVHIDWKKHFNAISDLERKLNDSTNWHFILLDKVYTFADLLLTKEGQQFNIEENGFRYEDEFSMEADDIQAVCCKLFPNYDVVLVTIDKDLDQLCYYDNVKIFNPTLKYKSKKGFYRVIENPLGVIEEKVRKGDISDNIIVDKKNDTEKDNEVRRLIIDLLDMPAFVEDPINDVLIGLKNKDIYFDKMPCPNSLGKPEKFNQIYESKNLVTMEKSVEAFHYLKEKRKEAQRASYEKRKAKLKAEKEAKLRS